MTIEPPESVEKFAERIWQVMQEQYMEEVAELIRLRDLTIARAAKERMQEVAAKLLQRQAEDYGIEHGQVDPTTGVWEATELEMQYCETLETAAQDILMLPITGDEAPAKSILDDPKTWEGIGEQE